MTEEREGEAPRDLEEVLTEWFLALDRGEEPDLEVLCPDEAMRTRVRSLLSDEPALLRELGGEATQERSGNEPGFEQLGDFRIQCEIGRGGMGTVYAAEQESLGRSVALKVLSGGLLEERAGLRFRREAELAAALDHPNIVSVYATGEEEGRAWIAMKRLTGPSLAEVDLPLAPRDAARIGIAVADALEEAHLSGIVHRDIKPGNVILDAGVPCVVDFGLARSQSDLTLTREGTVPGTLPYLAPELLADPRRLDPRVDVYALGATLYELLSGSQAFPSDDAVRLVQQIVHAEPARIGLPAEHRDLETIVAKAMEKDPAQRTPTALALKLDLEAYLDGRPVRARPIRWPTRLLRRAKRHPRVTLGALVAVTLIGVMTGVYLSSRASEARVLEETLNVAEAAISDEDYRQGLRVLAPLRAEHEADERVARLAHVAEAGAAFHALIDSLLTRRAAIPEDVVRECRNALEATQATTLFAGRIESWLAVAAWQLGEEERARELAHSIHPDVAETSARAVAAVRHLVDGSGTWDLAGVESTADDHVLVYLAMHLGGRSLDRQREELALALTKEPAHRRARFALAVTEASADRYAESRLILLGLVRGDLTPRAVWRSLARAAFEIGELDEAERFLNRIPFEARTAPDHMIELDLLLRRDQRDDFDARIAALTADAAGASAEILRAQAGVLGILGDDFHAADELFARARIEARDVGTRELSEAEQYRMHVDEAFKDLPGTLAEREALLGPLKEWGDELQDRLTLDRARGVVAWKLGELLFRMGTTGPGMELMFQATQFSPNEPGPRLGYVTSALALLEQFPHMPVELRERAPEGLITHLEGALGTQLSALVTLAAKSVDQDRILLLRTAFNVAQRVEDWPRIVQLADELLALELEAEGPMIRATREAALDRQRGFYGQ